MEVPTENIFNPEQFRSDLKTKTADYATNNHITYGPGFSAEENERKKVRAEALYDELLDDCAEALLTADNKGATMEIIKTTLVEYRSAGGSVLLGEGAQIKFYHDLALRLAKKAPTH
jgi:hypothetical protein